MIALALKTGKPGEAKLIPATPEQAAALRAASLAEPPLEDQPETKPEQQP